MWPFSLLRPPPQNLLCTGRFRFDGLSFLACVLFPLVRPPYSYRDNLQRTHDFVSMRWDPHPSEAHAAYYSPSDSSIYNDQYGYSLTPCCNFFLIYYYFFTL